MENYTPNSHKFKSELAADKAMEENKRVKEKVVTGVAKTKKKNGAQKFAGMLVSEDANSVANHLLTEIFVPAVKKLLSDIVRDGIDMVLYGGTRRTDSRGTNASRVSYGSYYTGRESDRRMGEVRARTAYTYDEIVFDNRPDAQEVLTRMDEILDAYEMVSVADLYDLAGVPSNYTDQKYGWTNLHTADIVRDRDGFRLKLPKPVPIN